ncbi:MAG: cytoplasmic tRNA 2-thiolation protein 2 [Pycnora praestabilis]|nr:MAG: cytoplasmic tRNA 2-thiolation protein 2 [Pycnora praestabilis]
MESHRVRSVSRDHQQTFMLALSFGVSSISLLQILDHQLHGQIERTGRTAYKLQVLFVDTSGDDAGGVVDDSFERIRKRFPRHKYTVLPMAHILRRTDVLDQILQEYNITAINSMLADLSEQQKLDALLASLPSTTSKSDILTILRTRLIVEFAKEQDCESIVWGDSTTRLAEKTLAETAKGRGFSLPWQVSDSVSPFGVNFIYPLRDVLRKELVTYSTLIVPLLSPLIIPQLSSAHVSVSAKETTIEDLMSQYFESVEENFPSIVANVVRTSSRLEPPQIEDGEERCRLCSMPVAEGGSGIHGWGGDQEDLTAETSVKGPNGPYGETLCYGCARSVLGTKDLSLLTS